jgi:tape measure domain-containing protein
MAELGHELGEILVSVGVDLSKLFEGFRRGQKGADTFDRALKSGVTASSRMAEAQVNNLGEVTAKSAGKFDTAARSAQSYAKQVKAAGEAARLALRQEKESVSRETGFLARGFTDIASFAGARNILLRGSETIAAVFGARELMKLSDEYTTFTNNLKTAGLEGEKLAAVQERLMGIAQKYGVSVDQLGGFFTQLSARAQDLGASQEDVIKLMEGLSASARIMGSTAEQQSSAFQSLTQMLSGSMVEQRSFNELNANARPILQAVADGLDRAGGSVSKLRDLIRGGNITTKEWFDALERGLPAVNAQAQQVPLTIGAAFVKLNNALGEYIGKTDQSLSASQRISTAIGSIANNLDTLMPILGLFLTTIGARYAAEGARFVATTFAEAKALAVAEAAAVALTAAQARLAAGGGAVVAASVAETAAVDGLAVNMAAAGAVARGFGASLLAAFGGEIGIAILAVGAALYYLYRKVEDSKQPLRDFNEHMKAANSALKDSATIGRTATDAITGVGRAAHLAAQSQGEFADKTAAAARALRDQAMAAKEAALMPLYIQTHQLETDRDAAKARIKQANMPIVDPETGITRSSSVDQSSPVDQKIVKETQAKLDELNREITRLRSMDPFAFGDQQHQRDDLARVLDEMRKLQEDLVIATRNGNQQQMAYISKELEIRKKIRDAMAQGLSYTVASATAQADLATKTGDAANEILFTADQARNALQKIGAKIVSAGDKAAASIGNIQPLAHQLDLVAGVKAAENSGNDMISPKGARGEMQVVPDTLRQPGFGVAPVKMDAQGRASIDAINELGRGYIQALYRHYQDEEKAFAAYNAGPGNVDKAVARSNRTGGSFLDYLPQPTVTKKYVTTAMAAAGGGADQSLLVQQTPGMTASKIKQTLEQEGADGVKVIAQTIKGVAYFHVQWQRAAGDQAQIEQRLAEQTSKFQADIAKDNDQIAAAKSDINTSIEAQAQAEKEKIDRDRDEERRSIEASAAKGEIRDADAKLLIAKNEELRTEQKARVDRDKEEKLGKQNYDLAKGLLEARNNMLETEDALALTSKQHRDIQLRILENQKEIERLGLEEIIHSRSASDTEKLIAEARLRQLDSLYQLKTDQTLRATAGPLESFQNELKDTVTGVNDEIERIEVAKLQQRIQELGDFAHSIGDAFGRAAGALARFEKPMDVLRGLVSDLAQTFTKQFIEQPVTDWVTKHVGMPLAKRTMSKGIINEAKKDGINIDEQQLNAAIGKAAGDLGTLQQAATQAATALEKIGTGDLTPEARSGELASKPVGTVDVPPSSVGDFMHEPSPSQPGILPGLPSQPFVDPAAVAQLNAAAQQLSAAGSQLTSAGSTLTSASSALTSDGATLQAASSSLTAAGQLWTTVAAQIQAAAAQLMAANAASSAASLAGTAASIPAIPMATGGFVSGPGTGTSDSVPAMLSNGEFVMNAEATRQHLPFLTRLNAGVSHFAMGGAVGGGSAGPMLLASIKGGSVDPAKSLAPLAAAAQSSTTALGQQVPVVNQFGTALMGVIPMLLSMAGGGGGAMSFLGPILGIAGAVLGGKGLGVLGGGAAAGGFGSAANSFGIFGSGGDNIYADGGWIHGPGTPTSDDVPIWASRDEFMVHAKAAQRFGPLLEAINDGKVNSMGEAWRLLAPRRKGTAFAEGGWIRDRLRIPAALNDTINPARLPDMRALAGLFERALRIHGGGDRAGFAPRLGDVHIYGAGSDERSMRRSAKQVATAQHEMLAAAYKGGMIRGHS